MRWWQTGLVLLGAAAAGCARAVLPAPDFPREYLQIGDLELSAAVERDGADIYSMVEVMNTGEEAVQLEYQGACAVAVVVLESEGGATRARWDEELWWRHTHPDVCQPAPLRMELPGKTLARILAPIVQVWDILGDSLPAGRYGTAVRLRLLHPADTTLTLRSEPVQLGHERTRPAIMTLHGRGGR